MSDDDRLPPDPVLRAALAELRRARQRVDELAEEANRTKGDLAEARERVHNRLADMGAEYVRSGDRPLNEAAVRELYWNTGQTSTSSRSRPR